MFEYKTYKGGWRPWAVRGVKKTDDVLNNIAKEGWVLKHVVADANQYTSYLYVFERPVEEEE